MRSVSRSSIKMVFLIHLILNHLIHANFIYLEDMTNAPFTHQGERSSELLALIHTDVCGPMSSIARGVFQYFITFTNDFSRYEYIYLMRHKFESFEKFKEF